MQNARAGRRIPCGRNAHLLKSGRHVCWAREGTIMAQNRTSCIANVLMHRIKQMAPFDIQRLFLDASYGASDFCKKCISGSSAHVNHFSLPYLCSLQNAHTGLHAERHDKQA